MNTCVPLTHIETNRNETSKTTTSPLIYGQDEYSSAGPVSSGGRQKIAAQSSHTAFSGAAATAAVWPAARAPIVQPCCYNASNALLVTAPCYHATMLSRSCCPLPIRQPLEVPAWAFGLLLPFVLDAAVSCHGVEPPTGEERLPQVARSHREAPARSARTACLRPEDAQSARGASCVVRRKNNGRSERGTRKS